MELTGKSLETTYEQSKQQRLPSVSASFGENFSFTISRPEDPSVANRRAAVLALAGQWKDDRSDEDIIKDIENARTFGREVEL